MKRDSPRIRSFRRILFSVLETDELKMALRARNVSGTFEKQPPDHVLYTFESLPHGFQKTVGNGVHSDARDKEMNSRKGAKGKMFCVRQKGSKRAIFVKFLIVTFGAR